MRTKFISIVISILPVLLAGITSFAQISPGELAKVHANLEGMSNCTKCHILGKKVSNQKCLDCHTELKIRVELKKGYHASAEVKDKECFTCHSDHHGVNFQIVRFAKEKFNHGITGFPLQDAHGKKQCTDCHKPDFIKDQKFKAKKFTYLGLNTTCITCHDDFHQQTLSINCSDCHDVKAFRPAPKFSHASSKFQLLGKHQQVLCIACHKTGIKNGKKFQEFKGISHESCVNCHKDVHNNKFGQNCIQCHSEQSFTIIKGSLNFDHAKTGYILEGKHQKVACNSCHKTKITGVLKHNQCSDCHTDFHNKQFARQGSSPDCSQCHTVKGFADFNFTFEQHNEGTFRLKGAHLAIPCIFCHIKGTGKNDTIWKFREIGKRCVDCHTNLHQGLISEKYYPETACENCHNETRWAAVTFDHQKTNFGLSGAHQGKPCRDCHFRKDNTGVARQQFKETPQTCEGCHADTHSKQFAKDGTTDCQRCHVTDSFKPASRFDHQKTLFPLDGKHKDVACGKCHKPVQNNGITFLLYKIKEFRCENCHH